MTRFTPLWQQGGTYPALTDRKLISAIWPSDGWVGGKATTVPNTMNVSIPAGRLVLTLAAGAGTVLCVWDAPEVVTIPPAPPAGQSRIDRIVLQVRDNAIDGGGNNDFIFQVITGTPTTGTPTYPPVPVNAGAMYGVTVVGGTANLNGVTPADGRGKLAVPVIGARVWQSIPMNYASADFTRINFDRVDHDSGNFWDQANQWMACPATGIYLINCRAETTTNASVNARVFLELTTCSGQTLARGPDFAFISNELQIGVQVTAMARLAAGDCVQVRIYQNTGAARTGNTGTYATFMEFTLLGSN